MNLLERRHLLSRALAGGVMLGAAAGLGCALFEIGWLLATAGASFDGAAESARFIALLALTGLGAGALAGAVEGLVFTAVVETAALFGASRRDRRLQAYLYAAVAVAPVASLCAQIFRGPQAQKVAHHDLYALAIGLGLLSLLFAAVRLWQRIYRPDERPRVLVLLAFVCLVAASLAYVADQKLLYRLYPFFHHALGVCVFAAVEAAVALAWLGTRRRYVALLRPRLAWLFGALAVAGAAGALVSIEGRRALRIVVGERAALAGPLVRALSPKAPPPPPAPSVGEERERPPLPPGPHLGAVDVVLVTIDAMRVDRLNARVAPNLTALAARGVVFDRAYAGVPHTSFSIATLLTGKYVYALSSIGLDAASHQTLPEIMRRERYKTAGFYPPSVFTIDRERLRAMEDGRYGFEYAKYEHLDARRRTDQVIDFFEREKPARAFVWVHYFEPHEPYEAHAGHLDDAHDAVGRYEQEIHFVDAEAARLVAYLEQARPHALVIVAADHGEEFGEHGGRYHGTTLYEEQLRVPLFFVQLSGGLAPRRLGTPVGLVDVAPTVLSLIGIIPSLKMRGVDLGPWLGGGAPPDARGPVFAEVNSLKAIVEGAHKLICDYARGEDCRAYDLAADPGEKSDRGDDAFAAELRARMRQFVAHETRFERGGDDSDRRQILDRARTGDSTVTPQLAELLADPSQRKAVARLLAALPPEPATRTPLAAAAGDEWADVALARLDDAAARGRVRAELSRRCGGGEVDEWCARAGLAVGDVPTLAAQLSDPGRGELDEPLALAVTAALGASHDPRAFDALLIGLGRIRTRAATVDALAALNDARALPTLLLWLPNEPYVPVRAKMVALVAKLAPHDAEAARRVLVELDAGEREPEVKAALARALSPASPTRGATAGTGRDRPRSGAR